MSLISDIVVSSAAAAFAHFGMTLDVPDREQDKVERTVARTPQPAPLPRQPAQQSAQLTAKAADEDCPESKAQLLRI